ncbi:LysR family transcriptional regulator [Ancylobacter sp. WKF20]|uniref:helix-turn-helix domain-containing protein n=1 Tax=Ancylobacter sp. WKF20 TaxID=3039801 RepID=UPI0024343909|nr:LysR family transcriptional regulator [Ancylobacter sp. WKF20]WGD29649.1 LysR family transcriptional regulator [Ancylobacter sp. WKF20]
MAAPLSTSIKLQHLRYFVAAVEHGSFRKAVLAVDLEDSSTSRRVRDLDEIGESLFILDSIGVNLTMAGALFEPHPPGARSDS